MHAYVRGAVWALLAGILMFGLLAGGRGLATYAGVQTPLQKSLRGIPGVRAVTVTATSGGERVRLVLVKGADLQNVMHAARARLAARGQTGEILLEDRTDARLEETARQMAFDIAQAVRTGHFAVLPGQLKAWGRKNGVKVRASMDARDLYVELVDGTHFKDLVIGVGS